ncbi:hypothetical protein NEUTE1DRAFT_38590 [Neurospora tetrasperma FGSC 2508]|uniref:Uncharacterized protein n=1 Tax=Neurospora tetrasperma (strain FGSC 2508 / ATCC MYA-4615 / P0657) TaxID=510951 RepID=F8MI49_NEUT8|nr:uncharacterized protein NEUTE1DRAFT_38590 [Neurospora tetrasperma FGSC 2508]EGO58905.1 hypothetical protein NEUTE1DRAFT_38590 [Neurospora tetrasperma FGSC 2508]EGZ73006.1 hypothetical protein NEUTE2DRAFT_60192 [Neurospora tetrasperma FGSC 2509]
MTGGFPAVCFPLPCCQLSVKEPSTLSAAGPNEGTSPRQQGQQPRGTSTADGRQVQRVEPPWIRQERLQHSGLRFSLGFLSNKNTRRLHFHLSTDCTVPISDGKVYSC